MFFVERWQRLKKKGTYTLHTDRIRRKGARALARQHEPKLHIYGQMMMMMHVPVWSDGCDGRQAVN